VNLSDASNENPICERAEVQVKQKNFGVEICKADSHKVISFHTLCPSCNILRLEPRNLDSFLLVVLSIFDVVFFFHFNPTGESARYHRNIYLSRFYMNVL
jgi:hypothetical protein